MSINSRTSMFNLTRPIASVNNYVTLERYTSHLWYLVSLSISARKKGLPLAYLSPVDSEIEWCYNAYESLKQQIELDEIGGFAFGSPLPFSRLPQRLDVDDNISL